ncbi:MAG TPA: trypsin-like peptidase domain-containing protein [Steroidobacteraceae bacterium]|jgi:S1-C subfamily serine protease|nr:trypsin-like peptidase domain-containing protein [Steroidobacteraceae bacterium]
MTFRLWAVASCAALITSAAAWAAAPVAPAAAAAAAAATTPGASATVTTPAAGEGAQPPVATPPAKAPAALVVGAGEEASAADWAATLERIAGSVVAIQIDQALSFDTERNTSAQATGFVVDAEHGLILTNRHVVTPGPVTAEATFLNREEVQLYPVYRDPVHDFGFYRYDPSKLKFISPKALPLAPQAAQVGREIRVVGNNAGEQLSILAGTLARLDREAPDYGVGRYNDFNTFYIQAASGTSGGSSGSPVIDIHGRVVALNAGGASGAASSFYLPLDRVRRALQLIQQGKPVTRGTLETEFRYRPYDELRRLGLQSGTEAESRKSQPDGTGMLVVWDVQPGSPSDGVLEPGDILVRVNGALVTRFEPLEAVLDDTVGGNVELQLQRGGVLYTAKLKVDDLDSITPASFLELGDAVVHTLSYQEARAFHRPGRGVFVAASGYIFDAAGVPRGAVITELNSKKIETLADFEAAVGELGDGARATVRYVTIDDPNTSQLRSIRIDRRWFPARACQRDDHIGYWPCSDLPPAAKVELPVPASAQLPRIDDKYAASIAPSLAFITFDMPYAVSGVTERNYHGAGLIIDAERGLIITDRNTVPVSVGDVRLTFAGTIEIPGEIVYVHPLHNLAVIHYDPKLIGSTPVRAARLDSAPLKPGETVNVVGLDGSGELKSRITSIADVDALQLPLSRSVQFRESNLEVASLVNAPDDIVGVLADDAGRVRGLWASFASDNGRELVQENRGMSSDLVAETLDIVRQGRALHSLEAEFTLQTLASARRLGLNDAWVQRIEKANPSAREVLSVARLVAGSDAARMLQPGDILLAIDDKPVTQFRDVELAVANKEVVNATVWRVDGEKSLTIKTASLSGGDIERLVQWAGATLQAPHRAISAQRGIPPLGVYIAYFQFGSPAARYGLVPGRRIVEVDGQPTPDLDAFLRQVGGRPDRSSLRIKTLGWNGAPEVITLKLDRHYWPAYELQHGAAGWERHSLE